MARPSRARRPFKELRLLGVPHYSQGDADGLCLYYAMSMMLAALKPEYQPMMHEPPRYKQMGSPLFHALRKIARREREFRHRVAEWFFNGMRTTEATQLLNRLFHDDARDAVTDKAFVRRRVRFRRARKLRYSRRKRSLLRIWTVTDIFAALDHHLPVIVSGGHSLGSHAALVIGYREGGRDGRWVCVLDPALVREEWQSCGDVFTSDAEAIIPWRDETFKRRPPALVSKGSRTELEPWPIGGPDGKEGKAARKPA